MRTLGDAVKPLIQLKTVPYLVSNLSCPTATEDRNVTTVDKFLKKLKFTNDFKHDKDNGCQGD